MTDFQKDENILNGLLELLCDQAWCQKNEEILKKIAEKINQERPVFCFRPKGMETWSRLLSNLANTDDAVCMIGAIAGEPLKNETVRSIINPLYKQIEGQNMCLDAGEICLHIGVLKGQYDTLERKYDQCPADEKTIARLHQLSWASSACSGLKAGSLLRDLYKGKCARDLIGCLLDPAQTKLIDAKTLSELLYGFIKTDDPQLSPASKPKVLFAWMMENWTVSNGKFWLFHRLLRDVILKECVFEAPACITGLPESADPVRIQPETFFPNLQSMKQLSAT